MEVMGWDEKRELGLGSEHMSSRGAVLGKEPFRVVAALVVAYCLFASQPQDLHDITYFPIHDIEPALANC
jgi:hypothetical protein